MTPKHQVINLYKHAYVRGVDVGSEQVDYYVLAFGCRNPKCCPEGSNGYAGPSVACKKNAWRAAWTEIQRDMLAKLAQ